MSHATGRVYVNGKVVAHFEYNGSCDAARSRLHATEEELWKNWRSGPSAECRCGKAPTQCILYTTYGGGFHWSATVCLDCKAIVGGHDPWGDPRADVVGPSDGEPEEADGSGKIL